MFISYMESMDAALDSIMRSKADFKGQKAVFGRVFDVLNEPDETRIQECPQNIDLYFDNVSFKYENSDSYVLRNASCKFEEGKKYLIKGKSGEGKSTMIKLLLGFNQPEVGEIMVGQHLVSNIAPRSLLKNIGVVMQENMFFNLSIRENLQIANNDATDEDIINALLDIVREQQRSGIAPEAAMSRSDVVNMALAYKNDKKIDFVVECDPEIPSGLLGDEKKIRRVVIKLINNAIKFTETGCVTLSIGYRKEEYGINLSFSVKDTGIGMREESLEKLEEIVNKLESGDVPLDDAIDEFNNAMQLVKICNEKLNSAEEAIAKIVQENGDLIEFKPNE